MGDNKFLKNLDSDFDNLRDLHSWYRNQLDDKKEKNNYFCIPLRAEQKRLCNQEPRGQDELHWHFYHYNRLSKINDKKLVPILVKHLITINCFLAASRNTHALISTNSRNIMEWLSKHHTDFYIKLKPIMEEKKIDEKNIEERIKNVYSSKEEEEEDKKKINFLIKNIIQIMT